jgi:hypothetical protein
MGGEVSEVVKDNWAAVLAIGAAIADDGINLTSKATDIFGKSLEHIPVLGLTVGTAGALAEIFGTKSKAKLKDNPRFTANGYDGSSPRTRDYFKHRALKKIGGTFVSALGSAGAVYTAVNTAGIVRHGRAVTNTVEHMARLGAEMKRMKQSLYFQNLMGVILKAKALKLVNRGGALAADCIPGSAIASAAVTAITGIPTNIVMKRLEPLITFAATELHWRAFVETRLTGALGGGTGPAMRIVHHLYVGLISEHYEKLGMGVQVKEFIKEPAGWMVLRDKMSLL